MTPKLLIINGNPKPDSLCHALAREYARSAAEGLDYGVAGTVTESGVMVVAVGEGESGATWNAQIDAAGRVTGTWRQAWSGMSGSLSGTR